MRAALDVETLLKLILVLVLVVLVLELVEETVGTISSIFGFIPDLLVLIIGILIVLWLLDRL